MAPKEKKEGPHRDGDGSEYSYVTDEEARPAEPAAEPPTRGPPARMTASKSKAARAVKKEKSEESCSRDRSPKRSPNKKSPKTGRSAMPAAARSPKRTRSEMPASARPPAPDMSLSEYGKGKGKPSPRRVTCPYCHVDVARTARGSALRPAPSTA
eukprot:s1331_g18.t1